MDFAVKIYVSKFKDHLHWCWAKVILIKIENMYVYILNNSWLKLAVYFNFLIQPLSPSDSL